jgi:hypothetical protein
MRVRRPQGLGGRRDPCLRRRHDLATSQVSGRRVVRDRIFQCPCCARNADLAEGVRCGTCHKFYCQVDCVDGACRSCALVLAGNGGRSLTDREIRALRAVRPWVRRGLLLESPGLLHVLAQRGRFSLRRDSKLLVFERPRTTSTGVALRGPANEREVNTSVLAQMSTALARLDPPRVTGA